MRSALLCLAVFSDVGNVYPLVSDLDLRDLRYTAGVGLRYKSALGPLRVDWGYKLDRRILYFGDDGKAFYEKPFAFVVTLGYAF